jgi:hypothetical protein
MVMITKQVSAQSVMLTSMARYGTAIVALGSLNQGLIEKIKTSLRSKA